VAPNSSSLKCEPCHAGSYAPTGSAACVACPLGTAPGRAGQEKCPCALGWHSNTSGDAAPGPATASSNASTCAACPDPHHTTEYLAATGQDECKCEEGYYLQPGFRCIRCSKGLRCPTSNEVPTQAAGFKVEVVDIVRREYSVYACLIPEQCPDGALGSCAGGAVGLMCALCPTEPSRQFWHRAMRQCIDCGESFFTWWVAPVFAMLLVVVMCVLYRSSLPKDGREQLSSAMEVAITMGLLLVLVQSASVFSRLTIPWRTPILDIITFCKIFSFDFDILNLDCTVGLNYEQRYLFASILPALLILSCAFAASILSKLGWTDAKVRCVNAVGLSMQALYIGFLIHGIKPFMYFPHPNNERSVLDGPTVLSGSPVHAKLVVCAVVHLLVYGAGFAASCGLALRRLRFRLKSGRARGAASTLWFRFLYFKFKPHRYYWSCVHLVRSSLLTFTPIIAESPHLQIVLLQCILVASLTLQGIFWPYRSEIHNLADISAHAALIALTTAGAFFIPEEQVDASKPVVDAVVATFCLTGLVFLLILVIPFQDFLRRCFMSKAAVEQLRTNDQLRERSFSAMLTHTKVNELFGVENQTVHMENCVGVQPEPSLESLVRSAVGSQSLVEVELTVPSEHPLIQATQAALILYEKKLRSRAQDVFDTGNSNESQSISWSVKESANVGLLIDRARAFVTSYAEALLKDSAFMLVLQGNMARLEQRFRGVYQACVCDMLQQEPGFDHAVGLARAMKMTAERTNYSHQCAPVDLVELFTSAVIIQERLNAYAQELAQGTGGTDMGGVPKHLFRMLEKQCLDSEFASGRAIPQGILDSARAMICYDSMSGLAGGLAMLQSANSMGTIRLLRVKERFTDPTSGGWSDILVNLSFPLAEHKHAFLPCEIQMVHAQMMLIRHDMGAHNEYAKFRITSEIVALHQALLQKELPSTKAGNEIIVRSSVYKSAQQAHEATPAFESSSKNDVRVMAALLPQPASKFQPTLLFSSGSGSEFDQDALQSEMMLSILPSCPLASAD